jgi:hypothetical protein
LITPIIEFFTRAHVAAETVSKRTSEPSSNPTA